MKVSLKCRPHFAPLFCHNPFHISIPAMLVSVDDESVKVLATSLLFLPQSLSHFNHAMGVSVDDESVEVLATSLLACVV